MKFTIFQEANAEPTATITGNKAFKTAMISSLCDNTPVSAGITVLDKTSLSPCIAFPANSLNVSFNVEILPFNVCDCLSID